MPRERLKLNATQPLPPFSPKHPQPPPAHCPYIVIVDAHIYQADQPLCRRRTGSHRGESESQQKQGDRLQDINFSDINVDISFCIGFILVLILFARWFVD